MRIWMTGDRWFAAFLGANAVAASLVALLAVFACPARGSATWSWGLNNVGQLGHGDVASRTVPTEVTALSGYTVVALAAGHSHTLAVTSDGKLWAWGLNSYGQLGLGDLAQRRDPTQVTFFSGRTVTAVAAGTAHSLALTSDGKLWAWGRNYYGQLGVGDTTDRSTPVEVTALAGQTITGLAGGGGHSLALSADGKLWAWGANAWGQLGLGDNADRSGPIEVAAFSGQTIRAIAAGSEHTLAATDDGTFWSWGRNDIGQLGLGDTTARNTPQAVAALSGRVVIGVAAGWYHSLAITSGGELWACGYNDYGQLGLGTTSDCLSPARVTALAGLRVTRVSAGYEHTLVMTSDRRLWACGRNSDGQLGLGDTTDRTTPTHIAALTGQPVAAPCAGRYHSLAVARDNAAPVADDQWVTASTGLGKSITLTGSDGDGDPLTFIIVASPVHGTLTGEPPEVTYTSDPAYSGDDSFTFKVSDGIAESDPATVTVSVSRMPTSLWTIDRTGTITGLVILRQFDLKRTTDGALLEGKTISFRIDGTEVGTGVTNAGGDSTLNWIIAEGPATRTITAAFPGDGAYDGCSDDATLTAQTWPTKMSGVDREGKITAYRILKAWLWKMDSTPVVGKSIAFYLDGTLLG
ncbi:MAG: cadherin-like domain-containing protein, partial [Chthonomonadales bacterium]|nr:cadherin-like domain-containing protein [Chthonomonadales bacterium]